MLQKNCLIVATVLCMCITALTDLCDAKAIFENPMYDDEKLLYRMAELIDSIGADDSDDDSGRLASINDDSDDNNSSSASNELKDMKPGERCILPMRKGVCRALIPRWTYDPIGKECKEFKFGGCDGNGNNFPSRKNCMDVCRGI